MVTIYYGSNHKGDYTTRSFYIKKEKKNLPPSSPLYLFEPNQKSSNYEDISYIKCINNVFINQTFYENFNELQQINTM